MAQQPQISQVVEGVHNVQLGVVHGNVHITQVLQQPARARLVQRSAPDSESVRRLMDGLPERNAVLNFMLRTFGTNQLEHLTPTGLHRVTCYAQAVINNAKPLHQPQPQFQPPGAAEPVPPELEAMRAKLREASARRMALYRKGAGKLSG